MPVEVDPVWVTWCEACGWNRSARTRPASTAWWPRTRRRMVAKAAEQMYADVLAGTRRPRQRVPEIVLAVLSALVLAGYVAFAVVIGWTLVATHLWWRFPLGLFGLGILWSTFPRPARLPKDAREIEEADAPHLWQLVRSIAAEVGAPVPGRIVTDVQINAGVAAVGWRRRTVLIIGLPFWEAMSPQERVFVLGHELGHVAGAHLRKSLATTWALQVLLRTAHVLSPDAFELWKYRGRAKVAYDVANLVRRGLALPFLALALLLFRVDLRVSQRAEFDADLTAARIAGAQAGGQACDRLLDLDAMLVEVQSGVRRGEDPWELVAADRRPPAKELRRRYLINRSTKRGVDETHPATYLRRDVCLQLGAPMPAIEMTRAQVDAIQAELGPHRQAMRNDLRDLALTSRS